jgi:hypothetical protein
VLGAVDFTTIEVWSKGGLVTYYLLFADDGEDTADEDIDEDGED